MDFLWIAIGIIILIIGIIGCVLPVIPGPAVSFVSLLILQLKHEAPFNLRTLFILGLIMAAVTILDYVVPVIGTKKFGGSKLGVRGSTIGLIIAVIILPIMGIVIGPFGLFGLILGPFLGAYVGETMTGKDSNASLKAAFGSFIGFITGIIMKLVFGGVVAYYFFTNAF
ncbi:DUF456 domain-containing protein [candidate division KSB1 bacterium]